MFINNIYNHKELLFQLTLKQIKSRYKQSVLGVSWAIIVPLGQMVIFTVIFSKIIKVPSDGIPYPIFSYCALLPWAFFTGSLNSGIQIIVSNAGLIQQVYFPRFILPVSAVLSCFVDFVIASIIFIALLIFYKVQITIYILLLIPILMLQIMFTIPICMLGSAIYVYYRDIGQGLVFITQLWMYVCPIVYPISVVPEKYMMLYVLNPMVGIIDGYRKVIIQGVAPNWDYLLISFIVTVLVFVSFCAIFKRLEVKLADII